MGIPMKILLIATPLLCIAMACPSSCMVIEKTKSTKNKTNGIIHSFPEWKEQTIETPDRSTVPSPCQEGRGKEKGPPLHGKPGIPWLKNLSNGDGSVCPELPLLAEGAAGALFDAARRVAKASVAPRTLKNGIVACCNGFPQQRRPAPHVYPPPKTDCRRIPTNVPPTVARDNRPVN